jgi:hypothetical protein
MPREPPTVSKGRLEDAGAESRVGGEMARTAAATAMMVTRLPPAT